MEVGAALAAGWTEEDPVWGLLGVACSSEKCSTTRGFPSCFMTENDNQLK